VDFRLLNGKPRATLIQRFDGTVVLIGPKGKKIEFEDGVTLRQIQAKLEKLGWVIGVEHLHKERETLA
jgi:ribulose bisphosphate carboxylase small subunit